MDANQTIDKIFKTVAAVSGIAISIFHLMNVSGLIALSSMPIRILHLMTMVLIVFLVKKGGSPNAPLVDKSLRAGFAALTLTCSLYILIRWESIISSGGLTNKYDVIVGMIMIAVILEATRRSAGWALATITSVFLIYPFIGPYLPSILRSRTYTVSRIFSFLFATSEGIYGIPISVSSSYIILFCIYGAFLGEFGAGQFLFNLAASMTKRFVAATAKTSIIFSALIGMISGSAAGNVAITGSLTIPMMIKSGYKPEKAGAISAVAATGGQIMPPIMGAAAFMMSELIGVSYSEIMKAALLPAVLYFLSSFIIVHLEAKKEKIDMANPNEETASVFQVLKEGWYFAIPIIAMIVLLIVGYSPFKSAYYSIIALMVVYTLSKLVSDKKLGFEIVRKTGSSLKKGAFDTVPIATACASAGIIAGILSITGLGSKLSGLIVQLSDGRLIVALVLTMLVSLLLGMGLPTTAAYLVLASVVAPALVQLGLPLLSAHMFVFFFGCISTITPPVALASYVAAGIAGTDLNKVGWKAFQYGLVSFILPYMFVYGPSLFMIGSIQLIIMTFLFSALGVFGIAVSIVGFYKVELQQWQRIILFIAGLLMVSHGILTDIIGISLYILIYTTTTRKLKKSKAITEI